MKAKERVRHIVVLMLENRAFDHMLGYLPGVEGWPVGNTSTWRTRPMRARRSTRPRAWALFAVPERDIPASGYGGPSHSYPSATQQLFGDKNATAPIEIPEGAPKTNNGFVSSTSPSSTECRSRTLPARKFSSPWRRSPQTSFR